MTRTTTTRSRSGSPRSATCACAYRPEGTAQFTSELDGRLRPLRGSTRTSTSCVEREPINDDVEVLFIGGGFSALLTSARLREVGVECIRIVERGGDVGGTWYWNRYPGVACDVVAYDYLPLLDEMGYVPTRHYAEGPEIFAHCQAIARRYDLYELAVFQTTVTSTVWDEDEQLWHVDDRPRRHDAGPLRDLRQRHAVQAEAGDHRRHGDASRALLPHVAVGLRVHRREPREPRRQGRRHHRHRRHRGADRPEPRRPTPRSCTSSSARRRRSTSATTGRPIPSGRPSCKPGWQAKRRAEGDDRAPAERRCRSTSAPRSSREEKIRRQENANIDYMMRIHRRIDEIVEDPATADSLKPWYMFMCKRPCFHNDYLPTFNRPNVHLVDTHGKGITEIGPKGPIFDGVEYELDVLIYATGFEVQKTGIYNQIVGDDGVDLNDKYAERHPHAARHPHPRLPEPVHHGRLPGVVQVQPDRRAAGAGRSHRRCIDYVRRNGYATIDVTHEAEEWWVQEVIAHRGKTNRNAECTPGYYNFEGEFNRRQDGNYNGGFPAYIDHMSSVRDEMEQHFTFT